MWRKIYFNAKNIESITEKAVLIKLPKESHLENHLMWYPKKFISVESNDGLILSLSFREDFIFKVFHKDWNYKKRTKKYSEITFDELAIAFGVVELQTNNH
ncbi:hypothetical protein SAMN05421767_15810 [Granulicatella balaenopterae]|uniref:Uncharacterized protein n=1 Tax=Granulicatella balaenopterae TaxID=137733 RepID=A0A1H9PHV6_9LACT|nr:hypothetical protein [Granulicatella balaenopterae]SER47439.1 hypothetical protein SAMN05421767_15810 [Granulicatella balaenopterae]